MPLAIATEPIRSTRRDHRRAGAGAAGGAGGPARVKSPQSKWGQVPLLPKAERGLRPEPFENAEGMPEPSRTAVWLIRVQATEHEAVLLERHVLIARGPLQA